VSQRIVELVIGRLVTDEGFRRRFATDPRGVIDEIACCGRELTDCERRALLSLDPERFDSFAEVIDPTLLKADLSGGIS